MVAILDPKICGVQSGRRAWDKCRKRRGWPHDAAIQGGGGYVYDDAMPNLDDYRTGELDKDGEANFTHGGPRRTLPRAR